MNRRRPRRHCAGWTLAGVALTIWGCDRPPVRLFDHNDGGPIVRTELCDNDIDDDGDGAIDCFDNDCRNSPLCSDLIERDCSDGNDDDGDGTTDCEDPDCSGVVRCNPRPPVEDCNNGIDDDRDGDVDCDDNSCTLSPLCAPKQEQCGNLLDDDGNGQVDCDDEACRESELCRSANENCSNGRDDDADTRVDCEDADCFRHPNCRTLGEEICNNGLDDNDNGAIDCEDAECSLLPICIQGDELCDNGIDDDGDGAADCSDPDCAADEACRRLGCVADIELGQLAAKGGVLSATVQVAGHGDDHRTPCVIPGAGDRVVSFSLNEAADVTLAYEQVTGDHTIGLFRAGVGEACVANPVRCLDPESARSGEFSLNGLQAGTHLLIVEGYSEGLDGQIRLAVSTGSAEVSEICLNGADDDGDGAVDCADLDCALASVCERQICQFETNLGALVVDGPAKEVELRTAGAEDVIATKCAAGGGSDKVVRLSMPTSAGLTVQVLQQGWHTFALHRSDGTGTTCTAGEGSCFDSNGSPAFRLSYGALERGVYYYTVDALDADSAGRVQLAFSAFSNRGPELCANEIDDDGDGLVDCTDPECRGVGACAGPVCNAEQRLGTLRIGDPPKQVVADTAAADDDQTVSCALGGGKDVVFEFELSDVAGLRVDCNQSGDHVLGLFVAGSLRQPCDKTRANCADLTNGPLACSFVFPNLQPGRYYLVAEAFRPGTEGSLTLNLSAIDDHAQEVCDNGIDDDGDGDADCQDSNCAGQPVCEPAACRPQSNLGVLAAEGPQKEVAVATIGAEDNTSTSCGPGGPERVFRFQLVETTTVEVDYAQFGNHVVAVTRDRGEGFRCDVQPVACQPSLGQTMGRLVFSDLAAGDYLLIVEAAGSSGAGSAALRLRAKR